MQMPKVKTCNAIDCAYLLNGTECHALAVTIGGRHPYCDTYMRSSVKGGVEQIGGVGACKVDNCKFNEKFGCSANEISVGYHEDHADCKTFLPKS